MTIGPIVFEWIEAVGWLASALTVATYTMNTMMPLRILAIASSVCFAIYAAVLQLWPLLAMELLLLPINLYRFWQILSLRGKLGRSDEASEPDFSIIKAYGKPRHIKAGTVVFACGDAVDRLYFLASGRVRIEEFDIELSGGSIFGEIAFFTEEALRTATARCIEDADVYELDEKRFMRLQFEDPGFGLAVMRTITRRLLGNVSQLQAVRQRTDVETAAHPLG
ncbi:MAG: cyclic nucleotide-binding domain-containing protein [Roseobacter sp.]|nr:cyclic nucleotide-binding domain-containing protein [Roseobacter sp.]